MGKGCNHFNSRPSARGDAHPHSHIRTARIFQFTPLREGRQFCVNFLFKLVYFNSRPSARGDSLFDLKAFRLPYFNSRPSARGDVWRTVVPKCRAIFQFTPLREGRRPAPCKGRLRGSYFNSRPSARGDPSAAPRELVLDFISIHAPPRGATQQARSHRRAVPISIHAPPRGATPPSLHK